LSNEDLPLPPPKPGNKPPRGGKKVIIIL